MKKKVIYGVAIVAFILCLVGAGFVYQKLSKEYEGKVETQNKQETSETKRKTAAIDFSFSDKDGKKVALSDFYGKPIVLNFWATWCGYCIEEMPHFQEAYNTYQEEVQFILLNATDGRSETREGATKFIKEKNYTFPVYFDEEQEGVYSYYVTGFPQTVFIDKEGNISEIIYGMLEKQSLFNKVEKIRK